MPMISNCSGQEIRTRRREDGCLLLSIRRPFEEPIDVILSERVAAEFICQIANDMRLDCQLKPLREGARLQEYEARERQRVEALSLCAVESPLRRRGDDGDYDVGPVAYQAGDTR